MFNIAACGNCVLLLVHCILCMLHPPGFKASSPIYTRTVSRRSYTLLQIYRKPKHRMQTFATNSRKNISTHRLTLNRGTYTSHQKNPSAKNESGIFYPSFALSRLVRRFCENHPPTLTKSVTDFAEMLSPILGKSATDFGETHRRFSGNPSPILGKSVTELGEIRH